MSRNHAAGWVYGHLQRSPRLKHLARSMLMATFKIMPRSVAYRTRCEVERFVYRSVKAVGDLPPIFHYWSNKYLQPVLMEQGYESPDDFFWKEIAARARTGAVRILSIACGRAELETAIAQRLRLEGLDSFSFHCVDLNQHMLDTAMERAAEFGLTKHFSSATCDLNEMSLPHAAYDLIIANQCLHHLTALERISTQLSSALKAGGTLLTSDVIGRNGHQLWPEAMDEMQHYWKQLPRRLRKDRALGGAPKVFVNYDHSAGGFEGIRAQDVLPCLLENFDFETCIAFGCLAIAVVDRRFGWNYDVDNAEDRDRIDALAERELALLAAGDLKPTQLLGKLIPRSIQTTDRPLKTQYVLQHVLRASN